MIRYIIGFLAGSALIYWLLRSDQTPSQTTTPSVISNKKQHNLDTLLRFFQTRDTVRNQDAVSLLGISPKTARNYFTELEAQGFILQKGATGRDVYYTLKR